MSAWDKAKSVMRGGANAAKKVAGVASNIAGGGSQGGSRSHSNSFVDQALAKVGGDPGKHGADDFGLHQLAPKGIAGALGIYGAYKGYEVAKDFLSSEKGEQFADASAAQHLSTDTKDVEKALAPGKQAEVADNNRPSRAFPGQGDSRFAIAGSNVQNMGKIAAEQHM